MAANGRNVKKFGEKRIVGYTESGEGRSMKTEVQKVLGSVHNMNKVGNVVAPDGKKSYMQNTETGQKTKIEYEGGQYIVYMWVPSSEKETVKESNKSVAILVQARIIWLRSVLAVGLTHQGLADPRHRPPL